MWLTALDYISDSAPAFGRHAEQPQGSLELLERRHPGVCLQGLDQRPHTLGVIHLLRKPDLLKEDKDGTRYVLNKRLVRANAQSWTVKHYNPAKTFTLSRKEWGKAQLVIGKYNRAN